MSRKPRGYWDNYDNCHDEAQKYESKVSFQKGNNSAYNAARKNGWIDEFFGENTTKPRGYWDIKENCYDEAKKYKSRGEFSQKNNSAYIRALNNGWLDEWFGKETAQKPAGYWTEEMCYDEALKYEYQSHFRKYSVAAYSKARKNHWIGDYFWLEKNKSIEGPWLIYAYEDINNKVVYVGLTNNINNRHSRHKKGELQEDGSRKYDIVATYFNSIETEIPSPRIKMEGLDTDEDAQYYEDWYRKAYDKIGWTVLNTAPTGIGKSSLGGCKRKWTEETLKEEIEKLGCTSRWDFGKQNEGAYKAALDLGIIEKLFPERVIKENGYWLIYENHVKEAEGCKSIAEYSRKNPGACNAAREHGFLNKLFPNKLHNPITEEELKEAYKYKDRKELSHNNKRLYNHLYHKQLLDVYYPIKKVG